MNLFLVPGESAPAIVYVGASDGMPPRTHLERQAAYLASRGFVGASIDYRRHASGEPRTLEAMQDAMGAVRYLRAHAEDLGVDPGRIGIVGASAGGLVAALAAIGALPPGDPGEGYSVRVQAAALLGAVVEPRDPMLAPDMRRHMEVAMGRPLREDSARWNRMSPSGYTERPEMRHVGPQMPPTLFLHSSSDTVVPLSQSTGMAQRLRAHGFDAEVMTVDGAGHSFYDETAHDSTALVALEQFMARRLREAPAQQWDDSHPEWSLDGSRIVFESDFGGRYTIWTMRADGTDLRNLGIVGSDPSWSPDGRRIAFVDLTYRLRTMNSDGTNLQFVTRDSAEVLGNVSWSPDGTRIAFLDWRDNHVYVARLDDGSVRRVEIATPHNTCPGWTRDGSRILLNSQPEGQADLYSMKIDGTDAVRITKTPVHEFCPRISPDGMLVAFQRRVGTEHVHIDLMTIRVDGSSPRPLTDHPSNNRYPSWSPDGQWIAFNSTRDGNSDIYVIKVDGTELRRLTRR